MTDHGRDGSDPQTDTLPKANDTKSQTEPDARPLKRSFRIDGHSTSISLEPEFWRVFRALAVVEKQSMTALLGAIDRERGAQNLSSAVRVALLNAVLEGRISALDIEAASNH
ncbi:MAG: ribbon-helix-helix domain-containing protein [Pseudomonadota bacterium]